MKADSFFISLKDKKSEPLIILEVDEESTTAIVTIVGTQLQS